MPQDGYDVVIIGGGPGGLSAALYAARGKQKTLVVEEKHQMGGQCATTSELENYPGIMDSGPGLMEKFHTHALKFGAEFIRDRVENIAVSSDGLWKTLSLKSGKTLQAKSVIIATGTKPRVLGIPGEKEFRGKGVSYCATCDADFYEDLDVIVVGSGNTAVEESVFLTHYVNQVTMIVVHDKGHLDADKIAQEQAFANPKINFVWNSVVDQIVGDELVTGVKVKNIKTDEITEISAHGVFMFVGTVPQTDWLAGLKDQLPLTPQGYIVVNNQQETQLPGVFAVGDVCDKFLRQVVTAAGDGASAAVSAIQYIEQESFWQEHVLDSAKTTLAVFWSPLQKESMALITELEKLVATKDNYRLVPIDTYKNSRLAKKYHVDALPTLVIFQGGKEKQRFVQPQVQQLSQLLKEC